MLRVIYGRKSEGECLKDSSETCCFIWFRDSGGTVEAEIFIGSDQSSQDL